MVWVAKVHQLLFLLQVLHSHAPLADRRPIDPPPIVQLRVIDPSLQSGNSVAGSSKTRSNNAGSDSGSPGPRPFADDAPDASTYSQSFLQNPYYFMFACLARPDDDAELHWLKVFSSPMTLSRPNAYLGWSHKVYDWLSSFFLISSERSTEQQ